MSRELLFDQADGVSTNPLIQGNRIVVFPDGCRTITGSSVAVASLDNQAARSTVFQWGGPEVLNPLEVVGIFENHTGNRFPIDYVPLTVLQSQKDSATDSLAESFAALMIAYAEGDHIVMTEIRKVSPFGMTSIGDYVQRVPVVHESN